MKLDQNWYPCSCKQGFLFSAQISEISPETENLGTLREKLLPDKKIWLHFNLYSADYAVGLLVVVLRRVAAAEAYVCGGRWASDGDYPLTSKVRRWKSVIL
jgi:hypothetical protein